ncbi:MAG: glycosyltransferase family 39 protein [Bacteroidota bacterium]|jgi:hypothetical protein
MTRPDKNIKLQENKRTKPILYDRLRRWFEQNTRRWLLIVLLIGLIASLLSFDVKPSVDGDDTSYVLSAMDIVHSGQLPFGFRTPGYPIVLALFVWIFGVNLVLLKATSLIFFLGIIVSLYIVFRNRLQTMVMYPLLLLVAINPHMLKYSHQTFSEILFTLLLIWTIHFMLLTNEKNSLRFAFFAAVFMMASFYIRIIGITLAGVAVIFFIWQHRWKQLGIYFLTSIALYSPIKIHEWTSGVASFGQTTILMLKNPYNTTEGMETISGYIERFVNNIFNYLNYQFPSALGISMPQEASFADGRLIPSTPAFFGVLISIIILIGCITPIFSKSKSPLVFLSGFILIYVVFLSVVLQSIFTGQRYLVPIIPFLFIGMLEGSRWIGNRWRNVKDREAFSPRAKTFMLLVTFGLTFANTIGTKQAIEENIPILKANLNGNEFAGFTEDWVNYLKTSLWIKTNLPIQTTGIICRKPELFLLYAGNYPVYGTYKIDQTNPDSIIAKWKSMNMTHLLYDNFQWSSTLRRYIQPVAEKYPQIFELVHQEGGQFPSYIFHINYNAIHDSLGTKKEHSR